MAEPARTNSERRDNERLPACVEVSMTSENNFFSGFTSDMSEGGVFVATYEVLPVGTRVRFDFKLGKGSLSCEGEVRWVREPSPYLEGVSPGMGLRFVDLPAPVEHAINDFIAEHREAIFFDDSP